MNALDILRRQKPYSMDMSRKYPAYSVIFDKSEVFLIPVSLGPEYAHKILAALNGAYFEGYLQKERELKVGFFEDKV